MSDDAVKAQDQAQVDGSDWRAEAKKAGIFDQISNERTRADELAARLKSIEDAKESADKEKQLKELEDKQQYDQVVKQLKAENEQIKLAHGKQMLETKLQMSLLKEGCSNDVFLRGALAGYSGDTDGIAEYVSGLKETNAMFFGELESIKGADPARSASPATSGKTNWEQIKQQLTSSDPTDSKAAMDAVNNYVIQNNGKVPPGFE